MASAALLDDPSGLATSGVAAAFRAELAERTRARDGPAGVLALIAYLGWSALDFWLEPAHARQFLLLRLVGEAVIVATWLLAVTRRVRGRAAEATVFAQLAAVQLTIAPMIPRVDHSLETYLLGFSLPLFASASLVVWHWRYTAWLAGLTALATTAALLTAPASPSGRALVTIGFYLSTAGALSVVGQYVRHQLGWREFRARVALEHERRRNGELLSELDRLSREDPLTGLLNRRGWRDVLTAAVARAGASRAPLAVLLVDLDHFKSINDRYGHAAGDTVLRAVADLRWATAGPHDAVARLGGDELALLTSRPLSAAAGTAVTLLEAARGLALPAPAGTPLTLSIGVAELHADDGDPADLLARADRELYRAKITRAAVYAGGIRRDDPILVPSTAICRAAG